MVLNSGGLCACDGILQTNARFPGARLLARRPAATTSAVGLFLWVQAAVRETGTVAEAGAGLSEILGGAERRLLSWLMSSVVRDAVQQYQSALLSYGAGGMFVVGFVESCSIPIPLELLLIPLALAHPEHLLAYVLVATAASVLGSLVIFTLARRLGSGWVKRRLPARVYNRVHRNVELYDGLAIGVPAMMPPFFPFMAFVMVAGLFEMTLAGFTVPMFIGRSIRYWLEAWLALRYGAALLRMVELHPWSSVGIGAGLLLLGLGLGRWRAAAQGGKELAAGAAAGR